MATARSTDPITSRLARVSGTVETEVLNAIIVAGPVITHEILAFINMARHENGDHKRQLDISCVSNVPSKLIRDGKIHVAGWKINPDTNNKCEMYAAGPRPGDGSPMPAVSTGPRRKKGLTYSMYTPDEVNILLKQVIPLPDQITALTDLLNLELKRRVI